MSGHLTDILAVLVVTETPTAGIHQLAFAKAATLAHAYAPQAPALRILGPHFSGSAASLREAVEAWLGGTRAPPSAVRILSGSATAASNRSLLTWTAGATDVSFAATVRTDDVMLRALHDHMARINPEWTGGRGVVLLVESNTSYGAELAGRMRAAQQPAGGSCDSTAGDPFPCALRVPFPMHISRLRNEARADAAGQGPRGSAVELRLRDTQPPRDQLPSMRPESTSAAVDTIVANILSTVRREHRSAIGILSTDKRDHLFLAQRIVREVPHAFLFSTEADLIYVHPDYRPFVRGMLVASARS